MSTLQNTLSRPGTALALAALVGLPVLAFGCAAQDDAEAPAQPARPTAVAAAERFEDAARIAAANIADHQANNSLIAPEEIAAMSAALGAAGDDVANATKDWEKNPPSAADATRVHESMVRANELLKTVQPVLRGDTQSSDNGTSSPQDWNPGGCGCYALCSIAIGGCFAACPTTGPFVFACGAGCSAGGALCFSSCNACYTP